MTGSTGGHLQTKDFEDRSDGILARRARWLAIVVGLFVGIAGVLGLGLGFAIMPSILVLGAVIQPRLPRAGRGLICAGAVLLSFWVFDIGIFMLLESRPSDKVGRIGLALASILLVALCDVAIVIEEIKLRGIQRRRLQCPDERP
jgi:hypothetical protein